MKVSLEISMYPLDAGYKAPIKAFVRQLRAHEQLEVVTNQMSTQVRGEFDVAMQAVNACMRQSMIDNERVVFVTKCLNADLDIARPPRID